MAAYCLFYWSAWRLYSQEIPAGVGGWDAECEGGEEGRIRGIHGRHGQGEERLQLVICCRTRGKIEGLHSGEQKEFYW